MAVTHAGSTTESASRKIEGKHSASGIVNTSVYSENTEFMNEKSFIGWYAAALTTGLCVS